MRRAPRILVVLGACLLMVLSISGTAFAAGGAGTHPVLDTVSRGTVTPDSTDPGTGCATLHVSGHSFFPSGLNYTNYALVFVIASTDGRGVFNQGNEFIVDSRGRINGTVTICDVAVSPDLVEWTAYDVTTEYFSNRDYTTLKGSLYPGTEESST